MKKLKFILVASGIIIIAACSTSKKGTTTVATSTVTNVPTNDSITPMLFSKPNEGIYAPGNAEFVAVKKQYNDATLEQLRLGYFIYTEGACINCHGPKNIYNIFDMQWPSILDNMAVEAKISDAGKDAVNKYVLSIKATQPK